MWCSTGHVDTSEGYPWVRLVRGCKKNHFGWGCLKLFEIVRWRIGLPDETKWGPGGIQLRDTSLLWSQTPWRASQFRDVRDCNWTMVEGTEQLQSASTPLLDACATVLVRKDTSDLIVACKSTAPSNSNLSANHLQTNKIRDTAISLYSMGKETRWQTDHPCWRAAATDITTTVNCPASQGSFRSAWFDFPDQWLSKEYCKCTLKGSVTTLQYAKHLFNSRMPWLSHEAGMKPRTE